MATETSAGPTIMPEKKIVFLDNIKVLLTVLVVVHHAFVAYGAPGGWYYRQVATDEHAVIALFFVTSTNQAFFMGLFFLISGYFIEPSLKRKGTQLYITDRFKRLSIPLIFFSLVLSPVTRFLAWHFGMLKKGSFFQYLQNYDCWIDFGGIWFLAALLLFALAFATLYYLKLSGSRSISKLNGTYVLLLGAGLGLITYFVRIIYPTDQAVEVLGFHLGQFPQYVVMFSIGIMAGRGKLAEHLELKAAKRFAWLAAAMMVILFPTICYINMIRHVQILNFNGGKSLQALLYSVYEQILGVCIMVAITGMVKHRWSGQSKFVSGLSRKAFAVYVFHPVVLVCISLILSRFATTPTIKLAIAAPSAVICSFLVAGIVLKIPWVNKVM